jgi:L-alanine-DL-glutamate epimerase-like enolase superfamily enzyme
MTRIASVETHMISVRRAQPVWTAHKRSTAWNVVLTEIRTYDGLVGYGEMHGTPMPQICEWVDRFGELVRGMDALANVGVWKKLLALTLRGLAGSRAEMACRHPCRAASAPG